MHQSFATVDKQWKDLPLRFTNGHICRDLIAELFPLIVTPLDLLHRPDALSLRGTSIQGSPSPLWLAARARMPLLFLFSKDAIACKISLVLVLVFVGK